MAEGYVYLIHEYHKYSYKIGKAKNVENRLRIFNVKLPFEWDLVHTIPSKDYHATEKLLHEAFKAKRIKDTEWFELDETDVERFKRAEFPEEVLWSIKGVDPPERDPVDVFKQNQIQEICDALGQMRTEHMMQKYNHFSVLELEIIKTHAQIPCLKESEKYANRLEVQLGLKPEKWWIKIWKQITN